MSAETAQPLRLDLALVARGLVRSRSQATDLIKRGFVTVDGIPAAKPGQTVSVAQVLAVAASAPNYVGRGAEKLIAALDYFGFDPRDRVALDVGASTGGFTEVLLARGAAKVYAVDVGHGQLHPSLSADPRVVNREGADARTIDASLVSDLVNAIVVDVSFISVLKTLPAVLTRVGPCAWLVVLIKPQFEAGRAALGKGGIVRDEAVRQQCVATVSRWLVAHDWHVCGAIPSPITGGDGNQEFLVGATR